MKSHVLLAAAALLAPSLPALAASNPAQGRAIVTVVATGHAEAPPAIQPQDLNLSVDGKPSTVIAWQPARGPESPLELVLLIDGSARGSFGTQLGSVQSFLRALPPGARAAIAYMQNGRAAFTGPLSSDPEQVVKGLRLPSGIAGSSGSPYFCLSDLAKNWPSHDQAARREVVLITDGIDNYNPRYDPNDTYVQAAIRDSVRAGLVVYSIYWTSAGHRDDGLEATGGQSLLAMTTDATGGYSYGLGLSNPVSFDPFFQDLRQRFDNQYTLGFSSATAKPDVRDMRLKVAASAARVTAPSQVLVVSGGQ